MGRRKKGKEIHGVFLLDKPAGISSNQALQKVRRLFDARKAGHTGTLDPFATGLLPVCLGEATKTAGLIMGGRKTYQASLQLGTATATGDTEGEVVDQRAVPELNRVDIEAAMAPFRGKINQVPPMYSALKVDGKPLYELARQGIVVERKSRLVEIHAFELESWEPPLVGFSVTCSKGTYVRTLAEDLAQALGTCGHLQSLRRTVTEPFTESQMHTLQQLESGVADGNEADLLLPVDAGLPEWPIVELDAGLSSRFMHGNPVECPGKPAQVRVYGELEGVGPHLLGFGEIREGGKLHASRVFAMPIPSEPWPGR